MRVPIENINMIAANRDRLIIISIVFVVLIVFMLFWLRSRFGGDEFLGTRSTPVSVISPEISDLRESLIVSAVLEAGRTVVISPKVGGTVREILVVEGSIVSRGDLLARIDAEPYRLEMEAAESLWRLAEASLTRTKQVFESAGASMQQLDEAQTQRDSAYSRYELAKMKLGYTDITAPVSGSVLYRYLDPGNTVTPQSPCSPSEIRKSRRRECKFRRSTGAGFRDWKQSEHSCRFRRVAMIPYVQEK